MKPRRNLSPEELRRVTDLRQGNASWLKIQKQTGIPRRIAKRAFEEWQRNQAWDELKEARKEIAAQEFRSHLDTLNRMAGAFLDVLRVPSSPGETAKSDDLLARLWQEGLHGAGESMPISYSVEHRERETRRIGRQTRALFQSLRDHTQGKVRWDALEEWKESWDKCVSSLALLNREAGKIMSGYLSQKPGLKERLEKATAEKDIVNKLTGFVLGTIWRMDPENAERQKSGLFEAKEKPGNVFVVAASKQDRELLFNLKGGVLTKEAATVCNLLAFNLLRSQSTAIKDANRELRVMADRIEELEDALDPLRLRPLILGSRCELCPA